MRKLICLIFLICISLLTACFDRNSPSTNTQTTTITDSSDQDNVESQAVAPVANAGADILVKETALVTLAGEGIDTDSNIVSYSWQQTGGTSVTLSDSSIANPQFTAPSIDDVLTFALTVTDNKGLTHSDSVTVTVNRNVQPTVNAGVDQSVAEQDTVTLTGTGSDTDGNIVSYVWQQITGTTVTLTNGETATASFIAPSIDENLVFTLTVTDDFGATHSGAVNVQVTCRTGFKGQQCHILDYNNPPVEFRVQVDKNGETRTFNLKKFNVRSDLNVKVVETDASVVTPELPPSTQYLGSCEEESGSIVSATILPNGSLRYLVSNGDGTGDWELIPDEENDSSAAINVYSLQKTSAVPFTPTLYSGAKYITPQKGGLTRDATIYESHLDFVISKEYVDGVTSDLNVIVRKAETSVARMTAHNLRDIMLDTRVSQILVRKDDNPDVLTARAQFDTYGMDNFANNVFTIVNSGGGAAYGCRNGGDLSDADEQYYTQDWVSIYGDGTWYGVLRHEYGHALGSEHFPGYSPEGPTIMSGNSYAKFSGDEILNLEWCYEGKGTQNFKSSTPATEYSEHEIPPLARMDRVLELDATDSTVIDVLLNDHDANGDKIAIKSFDSQGALGGAISFVPEAADSPRDKLKYVAQSPGPLPNSCGDLCSSSDLLLWLDASDKSTLIDTSGNTGNAITHLAALQTWKDKSSHNNDAEVYTATSNPEVHLAGSETIGNLPVVRLHNDLMEIRSLDVRKTTHAEITSIAVALHKDNYSTIWIQKGNNVVNRGMEAAGGRTVKSKIFDSNNVTEWIGMSGKSTNTSEFDSDNTGIGLGAQLYAWDNYAGAYYSTISLGELLIFNRKLTDQERQNIESYLVKKWSLKINDQFKYSITDDTGRTSQGLVYVPWRYEAKTDLTALDGQSVYLRNRKDCAAGGIHCDWHLSWFNNEAWLTDVANTADLVPWKLTLVPGTTNQFYIANNWGCPSDGRCNLTLQFNSKSELDIVNTNEIIPYEITLIPGTDAPGMTREYYIRNRYQCENGDFRCNGSVNYSGSRRVVVDFPYRDPIPWSIEIVP